jgi:hypothetical protein
MNCIPSLNVCMLLACAVTCAACGTQVADPHTPTDPLTYRIHYIVEPQPAEGAVNVTLRLSQSRSLLRELTIRPDDRISKVKADGNLVSDDSGMHWNPPESGGVMSWRVAVANRRNGDGYDAWLGVDFGLFRAEDVIPRASSRTLKSATSETSLSFHLPPTWSVVTQYFDDGGQIQIEDPDRRFDQPSGWIVLGNLGVRRERIAGMRVAVAGPVDHAVRRLDTIALLNWTLPELARLLPELPPRLTVVSAGEPMWRGGLSAPQSLFLHAERPLISENATSTLLHEVIHMSLGLTSRDGYDWIVEGLAEYYSLQLLQRSGTISNARFAAAQADISDWAKSAGNLCGPSSSGATTALAVTILDTLNNEILEESAGESSLDDVARELWRLDEKTDIALLISVAGKLIGHKPDALHSDMLPGCRTIASLNSTD